MAKERKEREEPLSDDPKYGHMTTGRRDGSKFRFLVSPIGEDGPETPVYSPSRTVNGAMGQRRGQISVEDERQGDGSHHSAKEYRRNERRGG
jgi:hypothetical protein